MNWMDTSLLPVLSHPLDSIWITLGWGVKAGVKEEPQNGNSSPKKDQKFLQTASRLKVGQIVTPKCFIKRY